MSKKKKDNQDKSRIYILKIVYNPANDKCEFVEEKIIEEDSFMTVIPDVNLSDYFDDDIVKMINESYEVGEA